MICTECRMNVETIGHMPECPNAPMTAVERMLSGALPLPPHLSHCKTPFKAYERCNCNPWNDPDHANPDKGGNDYSQNGNGGRF